MNNITHVRLVNAHSKCYSCHNHMCFFHQEGILIGTTCCRIHSRMIGQCKYVVGLQYFGKVVYLFSTQTIYNATLSFLRKNVSNDITINLFGFLANFVIKIGTIERRLKNSSVCHSQILLNIILNFGRCRCSKCNYRFHPYFCNNSSYSSILWSEIVTPLRYTVRLVNSIK